MLRWILICLLLGLSAVAADASVSGDGEARALTRQAQRTADDVGAVGAGEERARIDRALDAIARFRARIEAGLAQASPQRLQELDRAEAALLDVPVRIEDGDAPAALATISGTVTAQVGGAPLQNVQVRATEFSFQSNVSGAGIVATANTNASGQYTLTLPPGNWVVRATPLSTTLPAATGGYLTQAYNGIACPNFFDCPVYVGTVIALNGTNVSGINFQLAPGSGISGSAANGAGIRVQGADGNTVGSAVASAGSFLINHLPPGSYRVYVDNPAGQSDVARGDLPCNVNSDCSWIPSALVTTTAGAVSAAGSFATPAEATLSGVVRDSGGAVVPYAELALYSLDRYTLASTTADINGAYVFDSLRPTSYKLIVSSPTFDPVAVVQLPTRYGQVAHPNVACPPAVCDPLNAGTTITVTAGVAQTLPDTILPIGATVQGQIREASTLTPVVGASVAVYSRALGTLATAITDATGNYSVRGLPAGTFYVYADARAQNYQLTYNGNIVCSGFFCEDYGTPLVLSGSGSSTVNIDLQRGGIITGSITDQVSGAPTPRGRARLEVYANGALVSQNSTVCTAPTSGSATVCSYSASGLAPGSYRGAFVSTSVLGWVDMAFGGTPCPRGGCNLEPTTPLFATSGGTLSGISATLPRGALIRGQITDAGAGGPPDCRAYVSASVGFSCGSVGFNNTLDNYAGFAQPDRAGNYYSRTGFAAGTTLYASTYLLRNNISFNHGYIDQAYNGLACPYGSCGITTGAGLTVTGSDLTGIHFALNKGAAMAGTVTASSGGAPIPGVQITAYSASGRASGSTRSDVTGAWRIDGLAPGSYFVTSSNNLGYLDEVYNNLVCDPFCNPTSGSSVTVAGTATTSGINFALDLSASIQGTVRLGATPTANVPVELYGAIGNLLRSTVSGAGGSYSFTGLPAGRYYVRTRDTLGRADALYNALACVGNACQVRSGTPIDLAPPTTLNFTADLTLTPAATISGTITRASNASALSGVTVQLLTPTGAVALSTTSSASGAFGFSGLAAGNYRLVTRGTPGFIDLAWPNLPCPAACNGLNGTAITVAAGATVSGRDFALATGGSISGTLRSGPSAPIVGALVQVYDASGIPVSQISTNASGNYQVDTLPAGNFFVRTQQSLGFVDQVFNALPCSGYCDVLSGTPVPVAAGAGTGLVDFTLSGGLSISGRIRNASTSAGIALARVVAFDTGGFVAGSAQADASGNYSIAGLQPGTYRLRSANLSGYVNQVYNGLSCTPTPCSVSSGAPLVLSTSSLTGIDFALVPGNTISGTAGDSFNNPLPSGVAILLSATGVEVASTTISNGIWEFNGVANGTYYVLIRNSSGLVDQLYANVPCPGGACNITALGTPIVLTGTEAQKVVLSGPSNINLRLPTGQTIAGTVRDATTLAPLNNVTVYLYNNAGAVVGQAVTDGLGQYLSEGSLPAGTYYAATTNGVTRGASGGYVNALYSGQNCLLACTPASGTAISVGTTPVSGIDFNLAKAGLGITGTVRYTGNVPLALVDVEIYDASGRLAGTARTNSLGVYSIDGLPAGNYYARTRNNLGLEDRLYGGAVCVSGCNPLSGTVIAVPAVNQVSNIDFLLALPDALFRNGYE